MFCIMFFVVFDMSEIVPDVRSRSVRRLLFAFRVSRTVTSRRERDAVCVYFAFVPAPAPPSRSAFFIRPK